MERAESPDRLVAVARDADRLTPSSLIAVAAEAESPGKGRSSRVLILPLLPLLGSHMAARNRSTWASVQVGSCTAVSAHPTIWPRLLMPVPKLWLPPSVGSSRRTPFCHTKPLQMRSVVSGGKPPASQLQSSCSGSDSPVWEMPTTVPASFSPGQGTVLLGPPSVSGR